MSDMKKFDRWEPQKLFIQEILTSEQAKVTDTKMALETTQKLFFKRVLFVGVIIDMNISTGKDNKKDYAHLMVDDATGRINCTLFEAKDFDMIRSLALGKTVLVQGLAYKKKADDKDDYYVVPELVREVSIPERDYFLMHALFLRVYNRMPIIALPVALESVLEGAGVHVQRSGTAIQFSIPDAKERPKVKPESPKGSQKAAPAPAESWILTFIREKGTLEGTKKRVNYDILLAEATKRKSNQNALEKELINLVKLGKIHDVDGEWYELIE